VFFLYELSFVLFRLVLSLFISSLLPAYITVNMCLTLESCCQICYIKLRKRESHRSGSTLYNKFNPLL
jgi:hypothetical protein